MVVIKTSLAVVLLIVGSGIGCSTFSSKPAPATPSTWQEAVTLRSLRRLSSYDAGLSPGGRIAVECRACEGIGGHYVSISNRPAGESDLSPCTACHGTGISRYVSN